VKWDILKEEKGIKNVCEVNENAPKGKRHGIKVKKCKVNIKLK